MAGQLKFDDFLLENRITTEDWARSGADWETLREIYADHEGQAENLRDSAELVARVVQRFSSVHSVRWRVKSAAHLLEKIVRKKLVEEEKYGPINVGNYYEVVTDLVGVRALHLFKDDCFDVDRDVRRTWKPEENPVAYIRAGDPSGLNERFKEEGFEVKNHPAGYRSVHYVISTQPLQRKVIAELQVRTIFEEGWSEIDHRVRYPNFSNDELVGYFLAIFNRMAGSADEMGTFVRGLAASLQQLRSELSSANSEKERVLIAMEKTVGELEKMKQQDAQTKRNLSSLQEEIKKLRGQSSIGTILEKASLKSLVFSDQENSISSYFTSPAKSVSGQIFSDGSALEKLFSASAASENTLTGVALKNLLKKDNK